MKLVSWNINSLRSSEDEFLNFIKTEAPDIVMIQELRAMEDQLSFFLKLIPGYNSFFNSSERPGYSGTAWYQKEDIDVNIAKSIGNAVLDTEGRTISAEIGNTKIVNFYTPNGSSSNERLKYKLDFYENIITLVKKTKNEAKSLIIGGDLNIAHTELDLYAPKANIDRSGFLPIERKLLQNLLDLGLVDTFRMFETSGGHYSWWNMRAPKREENRGWRFDYFLVSEDLKEKVKKSKILKDVYGSDHAPILLEIDIIGRV